MLVITNTSPIPYIDTFYYYLPALVMGRQNFQLMQSQVARLNSYVTLCLNVWQHIDLYRYESEWVFCIEYQVVLNGKFLIMTSFSFHFHFALNIKWFWIFQYSNIQIFEWEVSYNDQLLLSPFPFPGFWSNNPTGSNKAAFELSRLLLNRSSLLLWQSFLRNHSDCSHFLGTFQLQWQRKTSDGAGLAKSDLVFSISKVWSWLPWPIQTHTQIQMPWNL